MSQLLPDCLEKNREKDMNTWVCTYSLAKQGLCTRPDVIFFTLEWEEEDDVLSPDLNFFLFTLSIQLSIWKAKLYLSGLACSWYTLIFSK